MLNDQEILEVTISLVLWGIKTFPSSGNSSVNIHNMSSYTITMCFSYFSNISWVESRCCECLLKLNAIFFFLSKSKVIITAIQTGSGNQHTGWILDKRLYKLKLVEHYYFLQERKFCTYNEKMKILERKT